MGRSRGRGGYGKGGRGAANNRKPKFTDRRTHDTLEASLYNQLSLNGSFT